MEVDTEQQQGKAGGGNQNQDAKRNRGVGANCSLCRAKMSKNRSFPLSQVREDLLILRLNILLIPDLFPSPERETP